MGKQGPNTFLVRFVRENVCSHKGAVLVPLVPGFVLANIFSPRTFFAAWGLVLFVWLSIWLIVPCNPNLNCSASSKRKDGTKALLVAFLMVYGVLLCVTVAARFFICSNDDSSHAAADRYGGGVLTNIQSLFQMDKVKKFKEVPRPMTFHSASETPHFNRTAPAQPIYDAFSRPEFGSISKSFRSHH